MEEDNNPVHYDTICLVYHDEINIEKSKALMEICSQAVTNYTPNTIYFQFSSGGGHVDSAITLYNFLKSLPCEIVMHNTGSIDSAANVVFMAGNKRYAVAHTSFLFHGVGYTFGQQGLTRAQINEGLSVVDTAEEKIAGILAAHSQLTATEIKKLFVEGKSQSATFAKSKGVISELKEVALPDGTPIYTVNTRSNG